MGRVTGKRQNSTSLRDRLLAAQPGRARTLLSVGPMSEACVRAAARLADGYPDHPLTLIASRRQVEGAEMGGGYVEGWTPEAFAAFARQCSPNLILARDHGGPYQHPREATLDLGAAMASAKAAFLRDLEAGFQQLHIDPSISPQGAVSKAQSLERAFELYAYCMQQARRLGREIVVEVGTDEQGAQAETSESLVTTIREFQRFCAGEGLSMPLFIVAQTGTKVLETENVGEADFSNAGAVARLAKTCTQEGMLLKEHNADYLSVEQLEAHSRIGVHALNVAPHFGVVETRALLEALDRRGRERFLELAYESRKWEKWLKPGSILSDAGKAIVCGHYVFALPEVRAMRANLPGPARAAILEQVTESMASYLRALDPEIADRKKAAA